MSKRLTHIVILVSLVILIMTGCFCTSIAFIYFQDKNQQMLNNSIKSLLKEYKELIIDAGEYVAVTPERKADSIGFYIEKTILQRKELARIKAELQKLLDSNSLSLYNTKKYAKELLNTSKPLEDLVRDNAVTGESVKDLYIKLIQIDTNTYYHDIYFDPEKVKTKITDSKELYKEMIDIYKSLEFQSIDYKNYINSIIELYEFEYKRSENLLKALEKNDISEFVALMGQNESFYNKISDQEDNLNSKIISYKSKIIDSYLLIN